MRRSAVECCGAGTRLNATATPLPSMLCALRANFFVALSLGSSHWPPTARAKPAPLLPSNGQRRGQPGGARQCLSCL